MREVKCTRRDTDFLLALARKFKTADGKKLSLEEVKTLVNQAAFDAQAPRINTDQGKKDKKDDAVFYKALSSIRTDLDTLGLTQYLSIGNGKKGGHGYRIHCDIEGFTAALREGDGWVNTREFLLEMSGKKSKKSNISDSDKKEDSVPVPVQVHEQKVITPSGNGVYTTELPVPELKVVGKIDLDAIPPKKPAKTTQAEKKQRRLDQEAIKSGQVPTIVPGNTTRVRDMAEMRRIKGVGGNIQLFGGQIQLPLLYSFLRYNDFYRYPTFEKETVEEKGIAALKLLITSAYDDLFIVTRDDYNRQVVKFKREDTWKRIKSLYRDRVIEVQFAVRNDIGYDWDEEFLCPYVKSVTKVNGKPAVVTLFWELSVESFQNMVLNCADALDGAKIINYRVNNQAIVTDTNRCQNLLNWVYNIDNLTRENGLVRNAVEIDSSLGFDLMKALQLAPSTSSVINNRVIYMMEQL